MAGQQIVTITTNHVCPMVTGMVPHVGGPIVGPGCAGVLIDGIPVSIMGDTCICTGPPDVVAQGYPGVLVNGTPIVVQNCMTAHGGVIPAGVPGVTVGSATPVSLVRLAKIPFPKTSKLAAALVGKGGQVKEAEKKMEELKKESNAFLPDFDFSV